MANISFTTYLPERKQFKLPTLKFNTPVKKEAAKDTSTEEVVLAPLPEMDTSTEEAVATPITLDWNDSTTNGRGRTSRQYLMDALGLKDYQAAALVGSFMRESGLNIDAKNQAEKEGRNKAVKSTQYGIGIGQWTHDRHDDFVNWTSQHGNSLQSQLDFAVDEIKRKYPEYLAALRNATNADEASDLTYVMYTGSNYRDPSNLAQLVAQNDRLYGNKHRELYGSNTGTQSSLRRQATREALAYKLGGVLKMQFGGYNTESHISLAKDTPKPYKKQYDLSWNPFKTL